MKPGLFAAWLLAAGCGGDEQKADDTDSGAPGDTDSAADTDTAVDTGPATDTDPFGCVDVDLGDGDTLTVAGRTAGGEGEAGGTCGGTAAPELEYLFTAPEDGTWVVDTLGSTYDTVLVALESCSGTELACDDDGSGDLQARLRLELAAGQQVVLRVDGYDQNGEGDFVLNLTHPPSVETRCTDGDDEDLDLALDCLDDDCAGDAACALTCPDRVIGALPAHVESSILGLPDEHASWCEGAPLPGSDESFSFVAPRTGRYVFSLESSWDGFVSFRDGCEGSELVCHDDEGPGVEDALLELAAGDEATVVIGGYFAAAGDYTLDVFEVTATEESCGDGIDDDYDTLVDCLDEDCALAPDCPESCTNDLDDDADGEIDCADARCASEAVCDVSCPEDVLGFPDSVVGSTLGLGDEHAGSCEENSASDATWGFTAPSAGVYTFDTIGSSYDTMLYVLDGCAGAELACNDDFDGTDSGVQVTLAAGQTVIVVVDGWGEASGDYVLSVQ